MKRDGSTRQQIEARINMQQAEEQREKADYVINNGDEDNVALLATLQKILIKITAK